jgi:hypothetical protein
MLRTILLALSFVATLPVAAPAATGRESLSLDGQWQIAFDHKDEGRAARWHEVAKFEALEKDSKRTMKALPFYRRAFKVPANWAGKPFGCTSTR